MTDLSNKDQTPKDAKKEHLKRMHAWLGSAATTPSRDYDNEDDPVSYGGGHSGWNR
ncbi:MAG: hypothetical protein K6E57_09320 [Fibrobacter sp.]|nr:hypothetical protein [Fibrobacter sp.]